MKSRVGRAVRRWLIAGLLIWLPLGVTYLTFRFLIDMVDRLLTLLPARFQPDVLLGFHVPGFGVLLALIVLLFTGLLVANFIGRQFVDWWEELLNRIPLVRSIYSGVKGLTETLVSGTGASFRKVVMIEYPRKEMWSFGFVTASGIAEIDKRTGKAQVCVYVPTTPNPTSGLIVMVPEDEVVELEMSVDAAMKMIVTLGVVVPPSAPGTPPAP
ncbi:MAG: DUF502 domain-containing protein [Steroidobacteraceae bacterium]